MDPVNPAEWAARLDRLSKAIEDHSEAIDALREEIQALREQFAGTKIDIDVDPGDPS